MALELRSWTDARALVDHAMPYLLAHEEANCVPIGMINALLRADGLVPPDQSFVTAERDGQPVALLMHTPPNGPAITVTTDTDAVLALARDLYARHQKLPSVSGQPDTLRPFLDAWQALSGQDSRLAYAEWVYRLDAVVDRAEDVPGHMIAVDDQHLPLVIEWAHQFFQEALAHLPPGDPERAIRGRLGTDPRVRGLRLWLTPDSTPVSMAGYTGVTAHGIRIGPVFTPLDQRGRGYGTALTAALSQALLDMGHERVYLFADADYPTSNRVYQRIGFRQVAPMAQYVFTDASA